MTEPTARTTALYRYPVKGLTPEPMQRIRLEAGQTVPFDRAFAIENGPGRFDAMAPRHLPKINFLMLMRDERLASLDAHFDEESQALTIKRDGKQVARGVLSSKIGRQMIEQFLAAYLKDNLRGAPKIVSAEGHSFSDVAQKCVHIISLASVRDLERVSGRRIDPLRFRPNIILDGAPAWAEFDWIDRDFTIGAGILRGFCRTQRCAATNVDPKTAARDMAIPALLERHWGHSDFGIYATVEQDSVLAIGDEVRFGGQEP